MASDPNPTSLVNAFKRLPSFKSPRDLNLSQFNTNDARTKKVFVPNLNVQRKKANESSSEPQKNGEKAEAEKGERTRRGPPPKGRPKKEYVQTSGVFSEGIAAPQKKASSSNSAYTRDSSIPSSSQSRSSLSHLKMKGSSLGSSNKDEEEDLIMKELLRDDFIEDTPQPDASHCPVHLPLSKLEALKLEPKKEETLPIAKMAQKFPKVKTEPVAVKEEEVEEDAKEPDMKTAESPLDLHGSLHFLRQANSSEFMFFQIPNVMPELKMSERLQPRASTAKDSKEEERERHLLKHLPAGRIGTLQILHSGRARIQLSDSCLQLELATQLPFKQELVSVEVDEESKTGKMINLGEIKTRLLLSPDWASLFGRTSPKH